LRRTDWFAAGIITGLAAGGIPKRGKKYDHISIKPGIKGRSSGGEKIMTKYTSAELEEMIPQEYRSMVRRGEWTNPTHGVCRGYAVTDMVILPKEYAYDFLVFCHRNPGLCRVNDITKVGSPHPPRLAPDADLRTDLPRYRVYQDGQVIDEPTDIMKYWRDDLVAFLLGCSFSFNWALQAAKVQFQYNGVFSTNIPCIPSGPFHGNLAVSCRLFKTSHDAVRAIQITSRHFAQHGPPIHIGAPAVIGIKDLSQPDLIRPAKQISLGQLGRGEIAMFWPCGATHRLVALKAKLPLMIVDYPGSMFMTDKLAEELAIL
jgi:uncharacterized protein YcsI (UPF0317 family)